MGKYWWNIWMEWNIDGKSTEKPLIISFSGKIYGKPREINANWFRKMDNLSHHVLLNNVKPGLLNYGLPIRNMITDGNITSSYILLVKSLLGWIMSKPWYFPNCDDLILFYGTIPIKQLLGVYSSRVDITKLIKNKFGSMDWFQGKFTGKPHI